MRLARGEIGILAPSGSNVVGPDYATAVRLPNGEFEIIVGDAKSRVSITSAFGRVSAQLPPKWGRAIDAAIGRVGLPNPDDVRAIQRAWTQRQGIRKSTDSNGSLDCIRQVGICQRIIGKTPGRETC